jgi:hypothetical protein
MEMASEPERRQDDRSPALSSAADMIPCPRKGYNTFFQYFREDNP